MLISQEHEPEYFEEKLADINAELEISEGISTAVVEKYRRFVDDVSGCVLRLRAVALTSEAGKTRERSRRIRGRSAAGQKYHYCPTGTRSSLQIQSAES